MCHHECRALYERALETPEDYPLARLADMEASIRNCKKLREQRERHHPHHSLHHPSLHQSSHRRGSAALRGERRPPRERSGAAGTHRQSHGRSSGGGGDDEERSPPFAQDASSASSAIEKEEGEDAKEAAASDVDDDSQTDDDEDDGDDHGAPFDRAVLTYGPTLDAPALREALRFDAREANTGADALSCGAKLLGCVDRLRNDGWLTLRGGGIAQGIIASHAAAVAADSKRPISKQQCHQKEVPPY